jgi:hypothetical protein
LNQTGNAGERSEKSTTSIIYVPRTRLGNVYSLKFSWADYLCITFFQPLKNRMIFQLLFELLFEPNELKNLCFQSDCLIVQAYSMNILRFFVDTNINKKGSANTPPILISLVIFY